MGSGCDSAAVHPVEEAAIPVDTAPANNGECDESHVGRMAHRALVLGRNVAATQEHSSPVEGIYNN